MFSLVLACSTLDDSALETCPSPVTEPVAVAVAAPIAAPVAAPLADLPVVAAPVEPALVAEPSRVDTWLLAQGGERFEVWHRMAPGETAWALSQSIGVPLWVVRGINSSSDLDHLHVGDWVLFPATELNHEAAEALITEEVDGC